MKRGSGSGCERLLQAILMAVTGVLGACEGASPPPDQVSIAEGRKEGVGYAPLTATTDAATGIISNGTVQLGVNPQGQLNVTGGTLSSGLYGTTVVGLRYVPTNGEATAPGCLCEGWGAADGGTGVTGYADTDSGGIYNLTVESFSASDTGATSVVRVGDTLRVSHSYAPSELTQNLYEATVTLENISGATLSDVRYSRVMDWDIGPNTFNEYVTIQRTTTTTDLLYSDDNGFEIPDPLGSRFSYGHANMDFEDVGPGDHGAIFDFGFGALEPGASRSFSIFYGAAGSEAEAEIALATVGAELYSLGQASWNGTGDPESASGAPQGTYGATTGEPHTFIFAFAGVGGIPLYLPATLGDFIWEDLDADGLQGAGEPGMSGVTVNLFDCDGNFVDATVTTDESSGAAGYYQFSELVPGCYALEVEAPAGYLLSGQNQGSDDLDSDLDPDSSWTSEIDLVSGETDLSWDGGMYLGASVGGLAWNDRNADGTQGADEAGLEGVAVQLIDAGEDGICGAMDMVVASTTTGSGGAYQFSGLPPGIYCVAFVAPDGFEFSAGGTGSGVVSDVDVSSGFTPAITLAVGQYEPDWNAGLYIPPVCDLRVSVSCDVPATASGSFVCSDAKPLDGLSMLWNGTQAVDVRAWKGTVGSTLLAEVLDVQPGERVTVTGYSGSSNDVYWEMFTAGAGFASAASLGQSTFHLSCSDPDMDGSEDCGKIEGDGKAKTGYLNTWLLDGMSGANALQFSCTPQTSDPVSSCTTLPGTDVSYVYDVTNQGDALTGVTLVDDTFGEIAGTFDLAEGESRTFQTEITPFETTTATGTFSGSLITGSVCSESAEATIEVSYDPCAECKGGTTGLSLEYLGTQTGTVAVYEGGDAKSDKLLYQGELSSEPFTFSGLHSDGTIGAEISIWIDGVQQAKQKVDCSKPVGPGLIVANFEILSGTSKDGGLMCPLDVCHPSAETTVTFKDKEVDWKITNLGELGLEISRISITWPSVSGGLDQIKRDADIIHEGDFAAPSAVIESGWKGDASKRTIDVGQTDTLAFKFKSTVSQTEAYSIAIEFTYGCTTAIQYPQSTSGSTGSLTCSKPIDELSMIWNGTETTVWVTAWKGTAGTTALTTLAPVTKGDVLTVSGFSGSPNDVYWDIYTDSAGTAKLGTSTFHLSCSDSDMDGPEDCGKAEGDGKAKTGYLNTWLLDGMVDSDETLTCTP